MWKKTKKRRKKKKKEKKKNKKTNKQKKKHWTEKKIVCARGYILQTQSQHKGRTKFFFFPDVEQFNSIFFKCEPK